MKAGKFDLICIVSVGRVLPRRRRLLRALRSKAVVYDYPSKNDQAFHSSVVDGLVPDLSGTDKALRSTSADDRCIDKIHTPLNYLRDTRRSAIRGVSRKGIGERRSQQLMLKISALGLVREWPLSNSSATFWFVKSNPKNKYHRRVVHLRRWRAAHP